MFIGKYLLIYHLRDTLPSLTEIFEILIVKIVEMTSRNKTGRSMNLVWSNWKTKFLRVVNSHAPFRTRRTKLNKTPWINSALKKGMPCRDAAKRKAIKTKNPQDWGNCRKLQNRINNKVKTTKASYYHNSFIQSEGNARRAWKTTNSLMSRRQSKSKAIKTKNPQDWGNCRKLQNRINNKVKTTKASYYHNSFIQSEGNARRAWKTTNSLMSRRQSNQIVKDVKVNDISICNSNEISNAFNEHFSTISPRLAREIPLTSDEGSLYLKNITEN